VAPDPSTDNALGAGTGVMTRVGTFLLLRVPHPQKKIPTIIPRFSKMPVLPERVIQSRESYFLERLPFTDKTLV
jgi:hypothetical protein